MLQPLLLNRWELLYLSNGNNHTQNCTNNDDQLIALRLDTVDADAIDNARRLALVHKLFQINDLVFRAVDRVREAMSVDKTRKYSEDYKYRHCNKLVVSLFSQNLYHQAALLLSNLPIQI